MSDLWLKVKKAGRYIKLNCLIRGHTTVNLSYSIAATVSPSGPNEGPCNPGVTSAWTSLLFTWRALNVKHFITSVQLYVMLDLGVRGLCTLNLKYNLLKLFYWSPTNHSDHNLDFCTPSSRHLDFLGLKALKANFIVHEYTLTQFMLVN